jgi:polyhydroxyalkanoate synthesis regulator phasin
VVPPVAGAASKAPNMDAREKYQDKRIDKGVASGEISQHEAKRLKKEQRAIDRAQKRAEADGQVTDKERARIDRMQDKASKDIHRQRHDEQKAKPPVDGGVPKQ